MLNIEKECCGCQACYNKCPKNAIEMIEDEKGFKYPKINKEKCINCGLCEKVCPVLAGNNIKNTPKAYACINKNEDIRMHSSSGGVFSVVATYIIKKGGVVFGAAWNDDFTGVEHTYVNNIDELSKLRGAKYVQSDINKSYTQAKKFLDDGKYVLFSGTPCQIEALKMFLGRDYERLFLQDIICHGVPSPKAWNSYKEFMQKQNNSKLLSNMQFRNKEKEGWNKYHVRIDFPNNNSYDMAHGKDIYMKAFLKNITLRESCTSCKFKKENRLSDITLADFWGINNIKPEMNDEKGTSLVIVNSKKGELLFNEIASELKFEQVDFYEAIKSNPSMNTVSQKNEKSDKFFLEMDEMPFNILVKRYVSSSSFMKKSISKTRRILKRIFNIK